MTRGVEIVTMCWHLCRFCAVITPMNAWLFLGLSFGAYVATCVAKVLGAAGQPPWRTCLAGMPYGEVAAGRRYDTPMHLPNTLVVHGECRWLR